MYIYRRKAMTIAYEWRVSQMDSYPTFNDHTDVVFNVHWTAHATDGDHEASVYGSEAISYDESRPYVPYSDLTESMIIDWLKDAMGADRVTGIEQMLADNIENQKNPPVVTLPLPWASTTG
jgi:hypothetical protein